MSPGLVGIQKSELQVRWLSTACAWDHEDSRDVGLSVTRPGGSQAHPDAGRLSLAVTVPCAMRLSIEKRAEAWRCPGIPHASVAG